MLGKRKGFSSRWGVLLSAIGASVGIGNIWRFPYRAGENGGSAFIIAYIVLCLFIGIPMLMFEFGIGRRGSKNPVDTIKDQTNSNILTSTAWIGIVASIFVCFIYFVIAGWVIYYLGLSLIRNLPGLDASEVFSKFSGSLTTPIIVTILFGLSVAVLLGLGVEKGIEKFSKIFMPILFILIIIIIIRSITLDGASKGLEYIFSPSFNDLTKISTWVSAMKQLFFSIGIGFTIMLTYGSYIPKEYSLSKLSIKVVIAGACVGIMSAMAIFPAVFAFGLDPKGGAALMFVVLPQVFNSMGPLIGPIFGTLFFFSVYIAALSSAISLMETAVITGTEKIKISRKKMVTIIIGIVLVFAILASLSVPGDKEWLKINGTTLFNIIDILVDNISLPISSLILSLVIGYGIKKSDLIKEISNNESKYMRKYIKFSYYICKFIAPIVISVIFIYGILEIFGVVTKL